MPGAVYAVSDLELASRLSFFLWSSIPDDELLNAAVEGKLKDPAVLERQVRRMLGDARSDALVKNFAAQWLFLRNLQSFVADQQEFPNFDENLRQSFRRETELFFQSIIREDRSVIDLIDANYTFVNERLARHYGIPNIYGSALSSRDAGRRESPRPPGAGKRADGHVLPQQDFTCVAGEMDSGQSPRHAATCAASQRSRFEGCT